LYYILIHPHLTILARLLFTLKEDKMAEKKKDRKIQFRCSQEEYDIIEKRANAEDKSVSGFCRLASQGKIDVPVDLAKLRSTISKFEEEIEITRKKANFLYMVASITFDEEKYDDTLEEIWSLAQEKDMNPYEEIMRKKQEAYVESTKPPR
jgi:tyrosyl-tRNA synthetase